MKKLKVHKNKKYLMWEDNTPFFYLADTAWDLVHKLTAEEIAYYLKIRKEQGFHVIQTVALAESDGIRKPNALGQYPLSMKNGGYILPEEGEDNDYWKFLDCIFDMAEKEGLIIGLLPTWGDKFNQKQGLGPEIFTKENACEYGKWIGKRYGRHWNLIWVLGGDRPLDTIEQKEIIDAMAMGIKETDTGEHLMTFHPSGGASSVDYVQDKEYIDFHSIQSGHGMECYDSHGMILRTLAAEPKPALDMESRYERFPACFREDLGYDWDRSDIRQNYYWNLLAGGCGQTYGHRAVWCFQDVKEEKNPYTWKEALEDEGAFQLRFAEQLRLSRPFFEFRSSNELLREQYSGMAYQCAGRGKDYAYFYSPLGMPIRTDLSSLGGYYLKASWFNPRNGEETPYAAVTAKESIFLPPSSGKGNDWVLILDRML